LTNYSINKKSDKFVHNQENGHDDTATSKWSLPVFKKYLDLRGFKSQEVFARIEDVVIKTILSIESMVYTATIAQVHHPDCCFDLFGFDILLDSKLKPWVLEVNLSPSLACESQLDFKVKNQVVTDLFNLIGVVPFQNREKLFGKPIYSTLVPFEELRIGNRKNRPDLTPQEDFKNMNELKKDEKIIVKQTNDEFQR
jgi:hypothetical protein